MAGMGWARRAALGIAAALTGVLSAGGVTAPTHALAVQASPAWSAGAAALTITPKPYSAADDWTMFPLCDTSHFNGARLFDFEEPYVDLQAKGHFEYPDPWCDANHNGRYDGLYTSGGVARLLTWVQSDIYVRALAISDGARSVVIESITSQGLGSTDVRLIRDGLTGYTGTSATQPAVGAVFVSSTHNESSPDPIGIYGAPADPTGTFGLHSGIDDYYITYLVQRAIAAGRQAVDALRPAHMRVGEFTPPDVRARLSTTFLTTDSNPSVTTGPLARGTPEATDSKALVLELVDTSGTNIETLFNWAAHNQQTGHAGSDAKAPDPHDGNALKPINQSVSDDWPGIFASAVEASLGGQAMFVAGTNGSIEDPHLNPPPPAGTECPSTDFTPPRNADEGCATLPHLTGAHLAGDVLDVVSATPTLAAMEDVAPHSLTWGTAQFPVPLQNQLFIAAFAAGLFAHRTAADVVPCVDSNGAARTCFPTRVSVLDLGPQLQLMTNPGEAYPALSEGNPFGKDQASCPERTEPPVPVWHATAVHHLQFGLGDDMLGYIIPAWGWYADQGVYADPGCPAGAQQMSNPSADYDQYNNYHKLESESVGPDTGNAVATTTAALLDCAAAGTLATCAATPSVCQTGRNTIESGRFLLADGSFTRKGRDGPVGMWLLPCGVTAFTPGTGILIGSDGVASFGTTAVNAHGVFMDFDGRPQPAPDINTRGMLVTGADGSQTKYFLDPYAVLTGASPGAAAPTAQTPEVPTPLLVIAIGVVVALFVVWRRRRNARRIPNGPGAGEV